MNQLVDMLDANTGDPDHLDQAIDNSLFGLAVIGQYFRAVLIRDNPLLIATCRVQAQQDFTGYRLELSD
jgi:hypothetical protein